MESRSPTNSDNFSRAVRVIGLTLYESSTYLEDMIAAGAKGYVLKTGAPTNIAEAIRAVAAGRTYFDENIPRRSSASAQTKQWPTT